MQFIIEDDGAVKKLVYCIADMGRFDYFSYEMLCANEIKGVINLLYTEHNGMDAIRYDVSKYDTLRNHLSFSITMDNLLSIFMQIMLIVEEVGSYLLDNNQLITDIGQIYYDKMYDEVKMIYFPVSEEADKRTYEERLFLLFREIVFSARFVAGNDNRYITELLNEISDINDYSLPEFKEVVYRLYEKTGGVAEEDISEYSLDEREQDVNVLKDVNILKVGESIAEYAADEVYETKDKGITESVSGGIRGFIRKLFYREIPDKENDEEQDYIIESYEDNQAEEVVKDNVVKDNQEIEEENNDETMVLLRGCMGVYTPYLIRTSNGEQISISKRVFRVGKDKRYADYVISDNAAISRAHAEFMIKDGSIYLTDEDSLNCTYVNGEKLVSQQEKEVKNGDVILFADEEYVLYC